MSFLSEPSRRSDIGGTIVTYRHLLSPQAMTVYNPLRTIAHCDIDAAYAQFEMVRLGLPDDTPLITAQWQSIIAVSYPARKYGIKRFTTIDEARKMCPDLVVQHVATYREGEAEAGYWDEVNPSTHKVSLDPYRRESLKILAIFKEVVPRGEIEKASIDEAFLDLTPMALERLLHLHPYLSAPPADAPEGLDSPLPPAPPIDWTRAGNVFPINGDKEEDHQDEDHRSDDARSDGGMTREESSSSWEDWALCIGAEIMAEVRAEVWKRLHYTCSAGIAHSKAMAKLCSAWKKPNNQTVLRTAAVPAFLRDMDFTDIRFLGGKLGNAIATEYNAKTVGDMLSVPLEEMQARFGEESIWVWNILRGIDHSEVKEKLATKSMLASKNVRPAVTTPEMGFHWLSVLAGELNVRLREAREVAPGLWPKTLVLGHRQGIEAHRSRQIPFPFTRNLSTEYIVKYARKLWDEATQPMKNGGMKLNNMSLSFTGLEKLEEGQKGIEGFFSSGPAKPVGAAITNTDDEAPAVTIKRSRSSSPLPHLPSTSSSNIVSTNAKRPRLPTLHANKRKTALESFLTKNGESSRSNTRSSQSREPDPIVVIDDEKSGAAYKPDIMAVDQMENVAQSSGSWVCPKCKAVFTTPEDLLPDQRAQLLASQKHEHDDYHFALDLQDGVDVVDNSFRPKPTSKVKKKAKKPEGIKAFFTAKGTQTKSEPS